MVSLSDLFMEADADSDPATMHDPDWSLLPWDLLQVISEKVVASLADYAEHLRLRAVCHQWRSTVSPRPLHLLDQALWLMLSYPPFIFSNDHSISTCLFYDLSASKFHSLHLPEIRGFHVLGSSHGWLILCINKFQMSLFNPITRAIIALPHFNGTHVHLGFPPPHVLDGELFFQNWDSDQYVMQATINRVFVHKAMLASSPLDPGCLVFVHTHDVWRLSFCKIGDDHWTVIEFLSLDLSEFRCVYDFTYSNGCLYTVDADGALTMYNLDSNTPSRVMLNSSVQCSTPIYLVDGSSPEILLVVHLLDGPQSEIEYMVYKFSNGEEPKWIQVKNIGPNVLFVGRMRNAIILPSANIMQLPGWGPNCLCYELVEEKMHYPRQKMYNHCIKLAKLDDG